MLQNNCLSPKCLFHSPTATSECGVACSMERMGFKSPFQNLWYYAKRTYNKYVRHYA